jgi:hypothetical protein
MILQRSQMNFTNREIEIIAAARKKVFFASVLRIMALCATVVGIVLMAKGLIAPKPFSYALIAAVFFSIAHPQFGWGPKYEELVKILEGKSKGQNEKP